MKTCEMSVCLYNSQNGELEFAISYEGLMSRKYLYLKAKSFGGEEKPYVRVKRYQTIKVNGSHICNPDALLELSVDSRVGVEDPRLERIPQKSPLIQKIDQANDKYFSRPKFKRPS